MPLDAVEQKLIDDVRQHGWQVMKVASRSDEPQLPPFAYTIGLMASFGWPELICYGLKADTMAVLLNSAVDELRRRSQPPADGVALHDVAEGFECRLIPVAHRHHIEHLGFAIWFARYRGEDPSDIKCFQMIWPDRNGVFPFERGCSEGVKQMQPLLSE